VSRFTVRDTQPPTIDPKSEKIIITWQSGGHNGCSLQFGPDGFLYISTGDGTSPSPPDGLNTGQDISDLLSSVLRIDVDRAAGGKAYRVPADNPFVKLKGARPEVWAYGFRNPWRMSFDKKTGDLWLGDVGWEKMEMIFKVLSGGNYGWSVTEGSQPVKPNDPRGPTPILAPSAEHPHSEACSITGGFVYHGRRLKGLAGAYVYGDYITGKIWGLRERENWHRELTDTTISIICFCPDAKGELYVVDHLGPIYRLAENPAAANPNPFPRKLSETGLFADIKKLKPAPGVLPFAINAEAWHDHARAQRLVALPGKTKLGIYDNTDGYKGYVKGAWSFPDGAVLAKTLSLVMEAGRPASARRIETQILHRHNDQWHAVNYLWNEAQTDAVLAPDEGSDSMFKVKDPRAPGGVRRQVWHHASRTECMLCHNNRTGNIWSFNLTQLNIGRQLDTLTASEVFEKPLPEKRATITNPHDAKANLNDRARAYLHVNCTHCHTRGGGGTSIFQTRLEFSLAQTKLVNEKPTQGDLGIKNSMVIAGGDPHRSVLYHRMAKLGPGRMPHFGSQVVDEKGLALIRQWIAGLPHDGPAPTADVHQQSLKDFQAGKVSAIEKLLAQPESALLLADAITGENLAHKNIRAATAAAAKNKNPFIRDLFLRFQEQPANDQRLGLSPNPSEILALQGDVKRGRTVFRRAAILCINCHRAEGQGREFGPDLAGLGRRYNREQVLDQILRPSKIIHPDYQLRQAGDIVGLIIARNAAALIIRDAAGVDHQLPANSATQPLPISAMPPGLLASLTAREAADLIQYLRSLK
jgi:putative heme-binding domain-containing protein